MSPISSEELWSQLKGDYLKDKLDPMISTDGLDYTRKLVNAGLQPVRIRAAFQYFLKDTTNGDKHGYRMQRFFNNIGMYQDQVRYGDGSRAKKQSRAKTAGSSYYKCEGCGKEIAILLSTDDDLEEYPPVWETLCPGTPVNSQFWTREQWDRWNESGCGGRFIQQSPGREKGQRADPREVREAVVATAQNLELDLDGDIKFFEETE